VRDVAHVPREEVVHRDDLVALSEQAVAEVAPEEAGSAGDQNAHEEA
jgi:hypothetical protein